MTDAIAPVPDAASAAPAAGLAPVEVAVAAPAIEAAAPAVVAEAAPAVVVETPVAVEAPAVEPVAPALTEAEAKPEAKVEPTAPERPKTLLEKADEERAAKEADKAKKPDEGKKPGEEAKPDEAAKPLEGEILPLDFKWPENIKVVPEQVEAFTDALRAAKTGDLKDVGQQLIGMHEKAIEAFAQAYDANAHKVWNDLIATKDKEILADPILGGAGHETAKAKVVRMRDLLVPESRRAAFSTFMNVTGAGSWPEFWHIFYKAGDIFDEPPMPDPAAKPPKDAHLQQPTGKFALLHDHPTSQMKRD